MKKFFFWQFCFKNLLEKQLFKNLLILDHDSKNSQKQHIIEIVKRRINCIGVKIVLKVTILRISLGEL